MYCRGVSESVVTLRSSFPFVSPAVSGPALALPQLSQDAGPFGAKKNSSLSFESVPAISAAVNAATYIGTRNNDDPTTIRWDGADTTARAAHQPDALYIRSLG